MTSAPTNEELLPTKLLAAWTQEQHYKPPYPPYINVTQVGSMVRIIVRGETKANGDFGDTVQFTVNDWTWGQICEFLNDGKFKFDCDLELGPETW